MAVSRQNHDRAREATRRPSSADTVFLSALSGTGDETRAVVRNDIYLQALDAARKVLRAYHVDRRRHI